MNGTIGSVERQHGQTRQFRPLTVHEALQYSPFTSIIPFDPSILPLPQIKLPRYGTLQGKEPVDNISVQRLNRLLAQNGVASKEAQQALAQLKTAFDDQPAQQYHMKSLKSPSSQNGTTNTEQKDLLASLSPFARMVLDTLPVNHNYASPDKSSTQKRSEVKSTIVQSSAPPASHTPLSSSQQRTALIAGSPGVYLSLPDIPSDADKCEIIVQKPAVVVPSFAETSLHDSSQTGLIVDETMPTSAKKRKRASVDLSVGDAKEHAVASEAVSELQDLLKRISTAVNNASELGMTTTSGISELLEIIQDNETVTTLLTAEVQGKVENLLSTASKHGRLTELDTQQLLVLEQICEKRVKQANEDDIAISDGSHDWSDDDIASWLTRLDDADLAFQSAWIILKVMGSSANNATLCPEELLQAVIDYLCKVLNTLIIPVTESRSSGDSSSIFEVASNHKARVERILRSCDKLTKSLRALLETSTLPEQAISALHYMLNRMMFVETGSSEKESVLGVTKFENFRKQCMIAIATLYAKYPSQRRFIVEELLTYWQRLPTAGQHARQYRLEDGKRLQMCTVLLVKILQTNALSQGEDAQSLSRAIQKKRDKRSKRRRHGDDESPEEDSESASEHDDEEGVDAEDRKGKPNGDTNESYFANARSRSRAVWSASHRIVNFLVGKASTASKTGEQPHRHLLDMFVKDIIDMSQYPQWPGAEIFVRTVLTQMNEIFMSEKSTVPVKNMALETLCTIAESMIDITKRIQSAKQSLEGDQAATARFLVQKCHDLQQHRSDHEDLVRTDGHYRIVLEVLQSGGQQVDNTVLALYVALWIASITQKLDPQEGLEALNKEQSVLSEQLSGMLVEQRFDFDRPMDGVSEIECSLAWHLLVMTSGYGVSFKHIISVFLSSIASDQILVRTRAIKSVTTLLEKDSNLLTDQPHVLALIVRCASDASSMVRDNALILIGKCLNMNSGIRDQLLRPVLASVSDLANNVRKRALKMLRDMYNLEKDGSAEPRISFLASVAGAIFNRIKDDEDSITEIAHEIFEELWLVPLWKIQSKETSAADNRIAVKQQMKMVIECTKADPNISDNLESLLRQSMAAQNKNSEQNFNACETLVSAGFAAVIDLSELPGLTSQYDILLVLSIMAKAKPQLLKQEQLEYLKPYVSSLASAEDLNLFRLVVIILRHVLPSLSAWQADFLQKIQKDLLNNITKLPKLELSEVVSCLWTTSLRLQDAGKLASVLISVLQKLAKMEPRVFDASASKEIETCQRLLLLAGNFCRFCNFEPLKDKFVNALKWSSANTVSASTAASVRAFAMETQPRELRTVAVEALGMICQAWPKNYNGIAVAQLFKDILTKERDELQAVVLSSFRDFYVSHGSASTNISENVTSTQKQEGIKGSLVASDNDEAAALIAQTFLGSVVHIALQSLDRNALLATEIIANIAKQGLVHPKQCGPVLIALSTSPQEAIAKIAAEQHRALHQQHESMLEREYMRSITEAFKYQRDVVQDARGFVSSTFKAKLQSMLDTIKTSKGKAQVNFMNNFCNKIDFEPATADLQSHLSFARFCLENLVCFEYGRNEDISQLMRNAERIVIKTGNIISHSIVTEIFKQVVDIETGVPSTQGTTDVELVDVDSSRLLNLTTAAVILTMFWETRTFLRKAYGLAGINNASKQKGNKDMNKAPVKTQHFNPQKQLQQFETLMASLASRERQIVQAKAFVDLLTIDNEFKVASNEADGDGDERMMTPDGDDDDDRISAIPPSGGSRTSQKRASLGQDYRNSPAKRGRGRPRLSRVTSTGSMDD